MNISLTPELEEMVRRKVESGMYNSASEVIREALRLFREQEQIRQQRLEVLRTEIQIGLDELDQGLGISVDDQVIEDIKARGRMRLASAARKVAENKP